MPPSRRPPSSATNGSPSLNSVHPVPTSTTSSHTHAHTHAHMHPPPPDDRDSRSEISGPTSTHPHPHLNPPPSTASSTTISKPRRALASHSGGHGNGNRDERGIGFNTNTTNTTNTNTTTTATTTTTTTSFQNSSNSTAINANGTHAHDGIEGISWHLVPLPVLHRYRHAYRLRVPSASSFYNNIILAQGIGKRSPSRAGYIFPHPAPSSSSSYSNRGHMAINPLQHHYHPGLVRDGSGLSEMSFGGDLSGMVAEDGAISGCGMGNGSGRGSGGSVRRGRVTREQLATVVRKNFNAQPISESDVIVNFLYSVKNQDKTFRLRFPPR